MLEILGAAILIFLEIGHYILGPVPLIIAGYVLTRRGNRNGNSTVWAIGSALLAVGASLEFMAIMLPISSVIHQML